MRLPINLNQKEIDLARKVGKERWDKKKSWKSTICINNNTNLMHYHGILGEMAAAKLFDVNIDLKYKMMGDDGYDLIYNTKTYDIKISNYDSHPLYLKLNSLDDFHADYMILCLRKSDNFIIVCGQISKEDFVQKYIKKNFGYGSRYCIDEKDLTDIK